MYEFENLVYLDVQKTGSTQIMAVLRQVLAERKIAGGPHQWLDRRDPKKIHFISVRDPLKQYVSLFRFGVDQRGRLHLALKKAGYGGLYRPTPEGFCDWLEFVLDANNAGYLKERYASSNCAKLIGFMSFRVLGFSLPDALGRVKACSTRGDIRDLLQRESVVDYIVHNEALNAELDAMLREIHGRVKLKMPIGEVSAVINGMPRLNPSGEIVGLLPANIPRRFKEMIYEREWLIYQHFGYSMDWS